MRTPVFLAQTQLRGSEGAQLTYKVGADEPYLTTSFSPIAGGGANVNPLSSYTFRTVGISVQATPRLVTEEGDILLELVMSNDTLGPRRLVGGAASAVVPDQKRDDQASSARRRIPFACGAAAGR